MKNLIQLLNANRGKGSFRVVAAAGGDEATVYVYSAIGDYYGIEAQAFVREIAAIEASILHVRINSPGGDVFAASFLMLAADEIEIADGAFVMIHRPWTVAIGDAEDLRGSADLLDKVGDAIAGDYQRRTGKSSDEVQAWMGAETWFSADEAIENGFADRKAETPPKADNVFNLAAYRNAPRALTERPPTPFDALAADRQRYEARLALIERAA